MNFLGFINMLAFSLRVVLLNFADFFLYKHFEATVSILFLIVAIFFVIIGSCLDCLKLLYLAWG